jgi:hypothetical protein
MDNQSAFTLMVQHLRTQGGPSSTGSNQCFYRHADGIRRCAVGVLISDADYHPTFENQPVESLADCPSLGGITVDLLRAMQSAHDVTAISVRGSKWAKRMEDQYVVIAKHFNLVVPMHPCWVSQEHTPAQIVNTQTAQLV